MLIRKASPKRNISRRAVLRGAGVAIGLPWLESLNAAAPAPKRFAVLFMGTGVNEEQWWAKGNGDAMELSKSLSPLAPLKKKINIIDGLFVKNLTGQGIHPAQTGSLLSGAAIQRGPILRSGVTVDQVIASHIGQDTAQSSMVLACEQPLTGYHETNFSMAYSSHISWQSPESPVPTEVYPSLAFDNLFENRGILRNASILDRVRDRAESLSRQVSSTDKAKLDEYLTSVRDVERRVERLRLQKEKADDAAKGTNKPALAMDRPANGLPEDLREHAKLMCDIIAMGFQADRTRVASLILANDLSAQIYPFLQVRDGHHSASHYNLSDSYERITRFHLSQLAYLAQKLDTMPEGNGTVLDNSCLLWLSNLWSGRTHDNSRLPVALAGGLGGTIETGRTLDYLKAGDENRRLSSLYLSIINRMGIKMSQFGDAASQLQGL
ncbi:MAG: DUF1552 domain-containing protein [Bryobacterales bacterium]|nr:DUF1552 domain-containing protein [Bryobacterales bacterium]